MRKVIINNTELDLDILNEYVICNTTTISEVFEGVEPFVDLTITSPPYFDAKVYSNKTNQIGFIQSYEAYLEDIRKVFKGVYDISKEGSSLYVNIDNLVRRDMKDKLYSDNLNKASNINCYLVDPFIRHNLLKQGILDIRIDIAEILYEIGFDIIDIIMWDKCKTIPVDKKCIPGKIYRHEYILYAIKGDEGKFNRNYRLLPNGEYKGGHVAQTSMTAFWEFNDILLEDRTYEWLINPQDYHPYGEEPGGHIRYLIPTQNKYTFKHPCPFPPKLIAHLIKSSTIDGNEVIFDPFGGTGMVKAVANVMGYRALTFDISNEYRDMHYNQIIPYVKKKWVDIEACFKEHESLLPDYTKSIFELQITKFIYMLTCYINKDRSIPNVLLFAKDYNQHIPIEGEKMNVDLFIGIDSIHDKDEIENFINREYEYFSPGYFKFNLIFIDKESLVSKLYDMDDTLGVYHSECFIPSGHLDPLLINVSIDDVVFDMLCNNSSLFCSNIITEMDKYKHLLPRKSWR